MNQKSSLRKIPQSVSQVLTANTSRLDPLPNVAIDAICEGLPVIAFNGAGGIPEMLIDAGLGQDLVVSHLDTQQMAENLEVILLNDDLRAKLRGQLVQFGNTAFDLDSYVDKLVRLANLYPNHDR